MLGHSDTLRIFLAEDNEGDVVLLKGRLSQSEYPFLIETAKDGEKALATLRSEGPKPHIILLDINMPKLDGFEVLSAIKEDGDLKDIPVVMLTSSMHPNDIERAKEYGANGYVNKPGDIDPADFVTFLDLVEDNPDTWVHIRHH